MSSNTKQEYTFAGLEELLMNLGMYSANERYKILNYAANLKDSHINSEVISVLEEIEQKVFKFSHFSNANVVNVDAIQKIKERYAKSN